MPQTLDRFRSSTWGWLRGTLAGWGTLLLVPIGVVGLVVTATPLPLGFVALAALIAAAKWFQNLGTTYEVTEERLTLHRGILKTLALIAVDACCAQNTERPPER